MEKHDLFRELLGIKVHEVRDCFARSSRAQITEEHTNFASLTHGGVIFALADCAFAVATNYSKNKAVAVQANINFIKPSAEGDTVTLTVLEIGPNYLFVEKGAMNILKKLKPRFGASFLMMLTPRAGYTASA